MSVHEITLAEAARKDRLMHEYVPRHLYADVPATPMVRVDHQRGRVLTIVENPNDDTVYAVDYGSFSVDPKPATVRVTYDRGTPSERTVDEPIHVDVDAPDDGYIYLMPHQRRSIKYAMEHCGNLAWDDPRPTQQIPEFGQKRKFLG